MAISTVLELMQYLFNMLKLSRQIVHTAFAFVAFTAAVVPVPPRLAVPSIRDHWRLVHMGCGCITGVAATQAVGGFIDANDLSVRKPKSQVLGAISGTAAGI